MTDSPVGVGNGLTVAGDHRDILQRAADMEERYRSRIKAQRDRLETMQHRLLELLGVIAECRQTLEDDQEDELDAAGYEDLCARVDVLLRSGVANDKRLATEEDPKLLKHLAEEHKLGQVYADLTPSAAKAIHDAMHHAGLHVHKPGV